MCVSVYPANVAAALSGILFFAIFFPYYFLEQRYADLSLNVKLGVCFLFNMAMSYGMKTVGLYEGSGKKNTLFLISITPIHFKVLLHGFNWNEYKSEFHY